KISVEELAAQYRDGAAAEVDAVAVDGDAYDPPARGCLVGVELVASQELLPERAEHAVRGAGDRVFVDTDARGEEAGDEVEFLAVGPRGHDDAPCIDASQEREVGLERAHGGVVVQLDEEVEAAASDVAGLGAEGAGQVRGRI